MFKIESYITPLITSYLDKYVKLKREDFQLSLWGGDAVLQKLDLRLDAIERAINLPVTLKSGHIHELRLHVPWTKLGSEPVVITINTIECVVKLRDFACDDNSLVSNTQAPKPKIKKPAEDLPPGYLQSMLNRIVNNMQVVVNNLILKFVEDDIVMSVNIKSAESFSVNRSWEQAFVDIDPAELILRKVINFNDLTICLDKRDASGKIETYQDPTVYRCVFTCRMHMQYNSLHDMLPNVTKFNLLCEKLDVSLTDTQLPMFFRLLELFIALYYGTLALPVTEKADDNDDSAIEIRGDGADAHVSEQQSWAGWAWSFVPQVLPPNEDGELDPEEEAERRKTPDAILAIGVYCTDITITLKQTEVIQENRYYGPQKVVFKSFSCVELHGISIECLMQGMSFFNARFGIIASKIYAVGNCPCGVSPAQSAPKTSVFFQSGPQELNKSMRDFCQASLFDPSGAENQGGRCRYLTDRDKHSEYYNEAYAMSKFSSFWLDYIYTILDEGGESPESNQSSGGLDMDRMREMATLSFVIGPSHLAVTSVMIHCLYKFLYAAHDHEYQPYSRPSDEVTVDDHLPGATKEQLESLEQFVSSRTYKLALISPTITFIANEHAACDMAARKLVNAKQTKKTSRAGPDQPHPVVPVPALLTQASRFDVQYTVPMYPRRIARWISQLEEPNSEFLHISHAHIHVKLFGFQASIYRLDNPKLPVIPFVMPTSVAVYRKSLLVPDYWKRSSLPLDEFMYELSTVNVRLSAPLVMLCSHIVCSWLLSDPCPVRLHMTSLVDDVFGKNDAENRLVLECGIAGADLRHCITRSASSVCATVSSIYANMNATVSGKLQNIPLLQGPVQTSGLHDHAYFTQARSPAQTDRSHSLVEVTWQLSQAVEDLKVPSVFLISISGLVCCADPALYQWLSYNSQPRAHPLAKLLASVTTGAETSPQGLKQDSKGSQPTDSNACTDPARSQSQRHVAAETLTNSSAPYKSSMADHIADLIPVIKRTELQIDVAQSCFFFPTQTQKCSSSNILDRVVKRNVVVQPTSGARSSPPAPGPRSSPPAPAEYIVCCLPSAKLYSNNHKRVEPLQDLPVKDTQLTHSVEKLPWTLTMRNCSIYTLFLGDVATASRDVMGDVAAAASRDAPLARRALSILKPAGLSSTVALTRKFSGPFKDELKSVGLCVHLDMEGLSGGLSHVQVELMMTLLRPALTVTQCLLRSAQTMRQLALPPFKPAVATPPANPSKLGLTVPTNSKASTKAGTNSEVAGVSVSQPEEQPRKMATLSENATNSAVESNEVQLSLWLQWTLPKVLFRLYHVNADQQAVCVSTSLEDLTTSVDVQDVYCKIKSKIGAVNVNHYIRRSDEWYVGDHGGILLSTSDKLARSITVHSNKAWPSPSATEPVPRTPDFKPRDSSYAFLSFTYTRALCKSYFQKSKADSTTAKRKYLDEICLTTQPLDVVFAVPVLMNVKDIFLVKWPRTEVTKGVAEISSLMKSPSTPSSSLPWLTSSVLPLLYVNLSRSRLFIPSPSVYDCAGAVSSRDANEATRLVDSDAASPDASGSRDDVYQLEMGGLVVTPQPDNPLPRATLDNDVVERLLELTPISSKPGSMLEDRQYQVDLTGFGLSTGVWRDMVQQRDVPSCVSLKDEEIIGVQNPALEWNQLHSNSGDRTDVRFMPLVTGIDLRVVMAPAVVYSGEETTQAQLVAGYTAEVNAVNDIDFTVSTNQIQLLHRIGSHYINLIQTQFLGSTSPPNQQSRLDTSPNKPERTITPEVESAADDFSVIGAEEVDTVTHVSGSDGFIVIPHRTEIGCQGVQVSTVTSAESLSTVSLAATPIASSSYDVITPYDLLFTAGKITCMMYTSVEQASLRTEPEATRTEPKRKPGKSDLEWKGAYPLPTMPCVGSDSAYVERSDGRFKERKLLRLVPIVYCHFSQPHSIVKISPGAQMVELSCYNFNLRGPKDGAIEEGKLLPDVGDFHVNWVETRPGDADPKTGVPPSLYTFRAQNFLTGAAVISLLLERPLRTCLNINKLSQLVNYLQSLSRDHYHVTNHDGTPDTAADDATTEGTEGDKSAWHSFVQRVKDCLALVSIAQFKTVHVQLCLEACNELGQQAEVLLDMSSLSGETEHRVGDSGLIEDYVGVSVDDWRVMTSYDQTRRPFVGPVCVAVNASAVWGQHSGGTSVPRTAVSVDVGVVELYFGQEHYLCLKLIADQILKCVPQSSKTPQPSASRPPSGGKKEKTSRSQHSSVTKRSQDDLRSGLFTYVFDDVDPDSQPAPYEIHFTDRDVQGRSTMTWTYPEPSVLTKVAITPVPFNVNLEDTSIVIPCSLQYWDFGAYQWINYVTFLLSENELCDLDLPSLTDGADKMAAACVWKIELETETDDLSDEVEPLILAASLAASVRVDSAVVPKLVPALLCSVKVNLFQCRLANHMHHLGKATAARFKPFFLSDTPHKDQEYAVINVDSLRLGFRHVHKQQTFVSGSVILQCDLTEFSQLTLHPLFTPALLKLHSRVVYKPNRAPSLECSVEMSAVFVYMRQSYVHTLSQAMLAWKQLSCSGANKVITADYVICNDTATALKFGQAHTEECTVLMCREMQPYNWRSQKHAKQIHLSLDGSDWSWCDPFRIDQLGSQLRFVENDKGQKISLIIKIKQLSTAITQIIIRGQLIIASRLDEHLEVKVISHSHEMCTDILGARQTLASYLLPQGEIKSLKVKVVGTKGLWTQEIPLSGDKMKEKRMVKIPSSDRANPVYAWCQIFCDHFKTSGQSLVSLDVILMPVFIVRSNLPSPLIMNIITPKVSASRQIKVKGQGSDQQLLTLPGDLVHSVTLQTSPESKPSSPSIFLSVGLLDQAAALPPRKVDLDTLCYDWETDDSQPLPDTDSVETPVRSRPVVPEITVVEHEYDHQDISLHIRFDQHWSECNTLRMEIYTGSLWTNQTALNLVITEGDKMWTVKKGATWATGNFTEPIKLGMIVYGRMYFSSAIELSDQDVLTSTYLPSVPGRLYQNGNAHASVVYQDQGTNESKICYFTIQSRMVSGIRKVTVRERYLLINHSQVDSLAVRAMTVPNADKVYMRQTTVSSVQVARSATSSGQCLYSWSYLGKQDSDGDSDDNKTRDCTQFLSFSRMYALIDEQMSDEASVRWGTGTLTWSQPVAVRTSADVPHRATFSMATPCPDSASGSTSSAYVVIIHEDEGVTYLTLYDDATPGVVIHNHSSMALYCGQSRVDLSLRSSGVQEQAGPLVDIPLIPANQIYHYTFPYVSDKFPQLDAKTYLPGMHLADAEHVATQTTDHVTWSGAVEITADHDAILNIPNAIDVRVHVEHVCNTKHIYLDRVTRAEMSTCEIRDKHIGHETVVVMDTTGKTFLDVAHKSNILLQGLESGPNKSDVSLASSYVMVQSKDARCQQDRVKFTLHGHCQQICFILLNDRLPEMATEIVRVTLDNALFAVRPAQFSAHAHRYAVCAALGAVQVDNQMFVSGNYDFPVLFMAQKVHNFEEEDLDEFLGSVCPNALSKLFTNAFMSLKFSVEYGVADGNVAVTTAEMKCQPLTAYVDDAFIYDLVTLLTSFLPDAEPAASTSEIPGIVALTSSSLRCPIRLQHFLIHPISGCVSVHASLKVFIGLDNSPLHFGKFEKADVLTTVPHLTKVLTMHYVSSALFRAGWVVGSMELLGNPGGLVRHLGNGVFDLFRLPIMGLTRGPGSFFYGMIGGVSSLLWHVSTGTLTSITNFASSVSRNMDRLSLDPEHSQRQEEVRRQRPEGLSRGLWHGLTGFGISILGAVAGIADQPLQSFQHHDAVRSSASGTAAGFLCGVGKGLIGVVTKPVGGAAEFVSQTGKGLLHTAGLTSFHQPRYEAFVVRMERAKNARVKYLWKLLPGLSSSDLLHVLDAQHVSASGVTSDVHLVLTAQAIYLIAVRDNCSMQVFLITEIDCQAPVSQPNVLFIYHYNTNDAVKTVLAVEETSDRVAEYLSNSSVDHQQPALQQQQQQQQLKHVISVSALNDDCDVSASQSDDVTPTSARTRYEFHCSPRQRSCFIQLLKLARRKLCAVGFAV